MKTLLAFILSLCVISAQAVTSTFTEFFCQTTGNNLNSGSTTADNATFTYTSAIIVGGWDSATGIFTVASGNPSSDGVTVGSWASVYVTAGATVATFVGLVTARDTTTITVSLTAKAGTAPATDALGGTTIKVNGAWKGPNAAVGFPFNFIAATATNLNSGSPQGLVPRVNMKSGTTYNITAGLTHALAGPVRFQGYTTTVADGGKATIDGGTSGSSYTMLTASGANIDYTDLILQNNGATGSAQGINATGGEMIFTGCVVNNVRGNGINIGTAASQFLECEVYAANKSNTAALGGFNNAATGTLFNRCISHDNTGANAFGFLTSVNAFFNFCIADSNGNDGFTVSATTQINLFNCDAYNNGSDGLDMSGASAVCVSVENCNFVKNTGFGIQSSGSAIRNGTIMNCAFGTGTATNSAGSLSSNIGVVNTIGTIEYAANVTPWTDPDNGDFRVSLAAARSSGRGTFTQTAASYTGAVGYPDIGAAQAITNASSSGAFSFTFGQ